MRPVQENPTHTLVTPEEEIEHSHSAIYLLRTTQQHNVQLSAMADQKASIIIGATFVVLALVLGRTSSGNTPPLSLILLAGTLMFSGLLAALAVMPRFGKIPKTDRNDLFFGHFTAFSEQEYVDRIHEMLSSDRSIHEAMARDIYQLGCVLRYRKYRYLGWSYRMLIIGSIASAGLFASEFSGWI